MDLEDLILTSQVSQVPKVSAAQPVGHKEIEALQEIKDLEALMENVVQPDQWVGHGSHSLSSNRPHLHLLLVKTSISTMALTEPMGSQASDYLMEQTGSIYKIEPKT